MLTTYVGLSLIISYAEKSALIVITEKMSLLLTI